MRPLNWMILLLAAALLSPISLVAEEAGEEDEKTRITIEDEVLVESDAPYFPERITGATKGSTPLRLLPQSATSLSGELLAEQNARDLSDALSYAAGINVQKQFGVHDFFLVRGFDSLSSALVLTDGAFEPEASFYRTYNVDRIEVLRGSTGFLYGGNAIGALVNLVRKRPVTESFARFGLDFGSDSNIYSQVDVNHSAADGRLGLRLNAQWQDTDGYRDGKESEIFAVNPVVSWAVGERTAMSFSAEYLTIDLVPDSGIPILSQVDLSDFSISQVIPDVPFERSYDTPFDSNEQDVVRLSFEVESLLSSNLTLRNKTYVRTLDWQSRGGLIAGAATDPFTGTAPVFRLRNTLDDDQTVLGNQLDLTIKAQTGSVSHDLVVGLELQQLEDEFQIGTGLLPTIDVFDPVETAVDQDFLFLIQGADAETTVIAPYFLDRIALSDTWQLSLGARYDEIDVEGTQGQISFDPSLPSPGLSLPFEASESQLSPFAGLLWAPTETWSFYANYAEAFSPQSTRVLAAVVEPEEGEQMELGAKASLWDGKVQAALAFYDLEKTNVAIVNPDGFTAQLGDQESRGWELELQGSPREGFHWLFNYSHTDAELTRFLELVTFPDGSFQFVDRAGNVPAFVPETMANVWLSQRWENGLRLGGGARFVGEHFVDEDNVFELDSYVIVDATIAYQFPRFEAHLWLNNLTDEEYFQRGFGNGSVIPADGFNLAAGLRFKL